MYLLVAPSHSIHTELYAKCFLGCRTENARDQGLQEADRDSEIEEEC